LTKIQDLLTLGVEDGSFPVNRERKLGFKTLLIAAFLRELQVRDVKLGEITVDGTDATDVILRIVASLKTKPDAVLLAGISYAGFNLIDPFRLQEEANLATITVTAEKPNNREVQTALQEHFPDWKMRWSVYKRLRNFQPLQANLKENPVFMETVRLTSREGGRILKRLTKIGRMPEPIRTARMIARGLTSESYLELLNS